jgi:hypothetical protein
MNDAAILAMAEQVRFMRRLLELAVTESSSLAIDSLCDYLGDAAADDRETAALIDVWFAKRKGDQ